MSNCPRADEAILYALRQLTADEERAFEQHLEHCVACRLKHAEIADTLDLLPLAAPPVLPPVELKAKCMQRIADEAKRSPAQQAETRRRWLLPSGVAAAVLALVVGSYALVKIQHLQHELAGFQQAVPGVERSVAMTGTQAAPGATGRAVVAREGAGTRITLQAQGLPVLQPGEAYQLWLIKDGKRKSGGVFVVDATGTGGVATWLPEAVEFDALGITREPDAFGQQPRGTKVLGSV
ncbi:MAG TPA: anti-sigma factor [Symbiobacteriaceae bacterium]|nr:anti-sigma factor [Symbiobacteriaceae bacterium]